MTAVKRALKFIDLTGETLRTDYMSKLFLMQRCLKTKVEGDNRRRQVLIERSSFT